MKSSFSLLLLLALVSFTGCNADRGEDRMASRPEDSMAEEAMAEEAMAEEAMAEEAMAEESMAEESMATDASSGDAMAEVASSEGAMADVAVLGGSQAFEEVGHGNADNAVAGETIFEPATAGMPAEMRMADQPDSSPLDDTALKTTAEASASRPSQMKSRSRTNKSAAATTKPPTSPFQSLPAGAEHHPDLGFATIQVFYGTDRKVSEIPLSQHRIGGNRDAVILLGAMAIAFALLGLKNLIQRRGQHGLIWGLMSGAAVGGIAYVMFIGDAGIEKHGVTYTADRGELVRGICQVTVPDVHDRGQVERPSLLRFEVQEDQQKHIVLTSATELGSADFHQRLSQTVSESPNSDLLVFIHGFNVDFQSAVARTAQIAVDLPFEGVPVCYSWPSQASLFEYTVDETNAAWTQTHLRQFLTELVQESGAQAINVVAHSMGNRPTTGAIVEMQREGFGSSAENSRFLDRIVLAAPDVDADRFRRDLAPGLSSAAEHVTLYASSDDQALVASKKVHGYPRAGESGDQVVVVPGIDTIDVSGIDLSLLGHSYYGDNNSMLRDLYDVVRQRLPAVKRSRLSPKPHGELTYWQLTDPEMRAASRQKPSTDR